jgi:TrmH family RNA methyltransferase
VAPARVIRIHSANAEFQQIEALRGNRNRRHRARAFFVEGVRPITLAIRNGWRIEALLYTPAAPLSGWAADMLRAAGARIHYELAPELMARLSQKSDTSELIAIVAMPEDDLDRIAVHPKLLALIFDRPASPGNLGSIIRSADALGADGLVITGHGCDPYDPETISATTGSLFTLPVVRRPSHNDLLPWLESLRGRYGDLQIVGSDEKGVAPIDEFDFRRPTVLLLGNETWGLSAAYREMCDALVRIPIGGGASSLNVAAAASIMLYEISRQRRALSAVPTSPPRE